MFLLHATDNSQQIVLCGFWFMGKDARAFTIQNLIVYTESLKQLGKDDATNRIDGIYTDAELSLANGIDIY